MCNESLCGRRPEAAQRRLGQAQAGVGRPSLNALIWRLIPVVTFFATVNCWASRWMPLDRHARMLRNLRHAITWSSPQ
ncbi:hypothetical protein [Candidatus Amarolinea dominans]|uniref:hypothetical protein n=1 Tax=Candidatus Amarolinea dominans TaxID=3140696 RepID=UPI003136A5A9|nr:hypothetical protein [Anaerolineae bacterium]